MSTNTYRLAVALQATAIATIDHHRAGLHTVHHSLGEFTVLARYRTSPDTRAVHIWARDRDGNVLAAATASTPADGGPIASHVTEFRSATMRWTRRVVPTDEQYRRPTELRAAAGARIGFHADTAVDYFLVDDWAPGRDPRDTTWSLLAGTPRTGLTLVRTRIDIATALDYAQALQTRCAAAV
jgi:hypothetical protein